MTTVESQTLQTAVLTISDPRGNWDYGWQLICQLAGLDPAQHPAPFRHRSEQELKHLGNPRGTLNLSQADRRPEGCEG